MSNIPDALQFELEKIKIVECYDDKKLLNGGLVAQGGNGSIYKKGTKFPQGIPDSPLKYGEDSLIKVSSKFDPKSYNRVKSEMKCENGDGCDSDMLLEAIIMKELNTLNLPYFVKFEDVCFSKKYGYLIQMENLKNASSFTNVHYKLSREQMLSILCQLTYALKMANEQLFFVHSDLIGQNIMIQFGEREKITLGDITIDNFGVTPVIIDFGYSRIQIGENLRLVKITPTVIPDKFNPEELFSGWIDLCKIYANPNFRKKIEDLYEVTIIHNISLKNILSECTFKTSFYRVVPPFPKVKSPHDQLLRSKLFDEIKY